MEEMKKAIVGLISDIIAVFFGGFLLKIIYGIVANKFELPMLNYWFWVLVFVFIAFCMNVLAHKIKAEEDD